MEMQADLDAPVTSPATSEPAAPERGADVGRDTTPSAAANGRGESSASAAVPANKGDAPSAPAWDAALLERGGGMTAEQAAQRFGTPEAMAKALDYFADQMYQSALARQQPPQQPSYQQPPPPQASAPQQPHHQADAPLPTQYQFDPQTWGEIDELYRGPLEAMNQHYAQQVYQHQQALEQLIQYVQTQEQTRYHNLFDDFVESLGEDVLPLVGKGPTASLPPHSPELQTRLRLDQVAATLASEYRNRGMAVPSQKRLLSEASRIVFRDHYEQQHRHAADDRAADRLRDQRGRFTAEPDGRSKRSDLTPEQAAREQFDKVADRIGLAK